MADVTSHAPGTFSWPELATTDQKGAVAFYRALFGWDLKETPIGPTEMYSMFQMRDKEVAAGVHHARRRTAERRAAPLEQLRDRRERRRFHQPSEATWREGVGAAIRGDGRRPDGSAARTRPARSFRYGSRSGASAPESASEPGALCWTELTTSDTKAAEDVLYAAVRLVAETQRGGRTVYRDTEFSVNGTPSIGMMPKPPHMPAHIPSFWMPYFQVLERGCIGVEGERARRQAVPRTAGHPGRRPLYDRDGSAGSRVRPVPGACLKGHL